MAVNSDNQTNPIREQYMSIENRNFLSPIGFQFTIDRMRGVDFFCQSANIPSVSLGAADTYTRLNKIPQPGDELQYEDLFIRFLVDENMKNWYQVSNWMREIATPYSTKEFKYDRGSIESVNKREATYDYASANNQWRCDCSLLVLSSNYRVVAEFVFRDAWPTSLSTLNFDASVPDVNYFTAEVSLKYNYYDYFIYEAATATDATMPPDYRRSSLGVVLES
tara:strand:+ start:2094 stop:2759 length:666 start_codon:yes stop_codon:yes gene_type:complete